MTKRKGRIITAKELRTGDVLMPPAVHAESVISQVHIFRDDVFISLANGATVEMPHDAKVKVSRSTRVVNHDEPYIVFSSGV